MTAPEVGVASRWVTPARLVMAIFFVQAFVLNNWFPRIPDVQATLGLGPAELSVALLGMPIGGFLATLFAARLIEHLTPRRTMMGCFLVYALAQLLPGWAWSLPTLFAALFAMGLSYVVMDIAANVEATRIQIDSGRRILSTCHGFWSVGSMAGLLIGSAFAEFGIATSWHLLIVQIAAAPIGVWIVTMLPEMRQVRSVDGPRAPMFSLPTLAMAGLCIFAFGVILGELTTRNWGAAYLREVIGASPAGAGVGFAAFSLGMVVFRFVGDRLADRFGAAVVGRLCAVAAIGGLLAIVTAVNLPLAVFGFALLGVGVSVGFPLAVTAAASLPDRTPAANVAALSLVAYSSTLVGPPLVGFVAESAGLRIGLAATLPLMILSALFAGALGRRRKRLAEEPLPAFPAD